MTGSARLARAVRASSLAIALVGVPDRRFVELSAPCAAFLGSEPAELRGTDALEVSDHPETSGRAYAVVASGLLDGYHARRILRGAGGPVEYSIWTRVLRRTGTDADLVVVLAPVRAQLGAREQRFIARLDTVHPDDVATTLTAIETGAHASASERVIELERRLRHIAREVEAAGVGTDFRQVPDPETVPGLQDLTPRQRDVVNRFSQGERVPEIARAMYLSPSTVRNHLAHLFRKVGVHSQSEFLDVLRRRP